jgi:hypothetical protein
MQTKSEIKIKLRDWMTASSQLLKVAAPDKIGVSDISFMFRAQYGIKMTDKWVERALYGIKKKP